MMFNHELYQSLITDVRKVIRALRAFEDSVTLHNGETLALTYDIHWNKGYLFWQGFFGNAIYNNMRVAFPRTTTQWTDELDAAIFECGY